MKFKEWLLRELTEITPEITERFSAMEADDLLHEFEKTVAIIYSAETDKVYYNRQQAYHSDLLDYMSWYGPDDKKDYLAAKRVRRSEAPGVVGRFGWRGKNKLLPEDMKVFAFYTGKNYKHQLAHRALELLLNDEMAQVKETDLIALGTKVEPLYQFLGKPAPATQAFDMNSLKITNDPKRVEELRRIYKTGRLPNGMDLSAGEKEFIRGQLDLFDNKVVKKNPWQSALEKNKLIAPGTNFRTPYSDATNYEL